MRNRTKLILTALAASMLLALAVSTASAGHFRVTEKNFEVIWNAAQTGKTNLSLIDNGGHTITCPYTLLGSFTERTIFKRAGARIGQINHATVGTCSTGALTVLQETLPWGIQYSSFSGALPNITAITLNITGLAFRFEIGGGTTCLFSTEAAEPFVGIVESFEAGGRVENLRVDETRTIAFTGFICSLPSPARFRGTALVRNLPGTAKITVTLI